VQVEFDHHSLKIDGARVLIRSGSLHYFRLPATHLWRDRIEKMRDAGLNAVDLYYPWNYHSEVAGEYDFAGSRDLDLLHDLIEAAGMYLIARPGPYVCAEIDAGGLPAWLLRAPGVVPRCRSQFGFAYSLDYMKAVREWFEQIVPRFASRPNLILAQIENEYTVPAPLAELPEDFIDLLVRWFGTSGLRFVFSSRWFRRLASVGSDRPDDRGRGQTNPYMGDLYNMMREFGVRVPIFHNDLRSSSGRQANADILAIDRYPITDFTRDWRDDSSTFNAFLGDEAALDAHRAENPVFYPELQGGWYDAWGGAGYARVRELLGPDAIDNTTKAALAARATIWNYYMFCGGVTWGYMASPDVYSSYDYGAPVGEAGQLGARYEAVRVLNEFLSRYEQDLAETTVEDAARWCPEHLITRCGPENRYVFLRNASRQPVRLPTPESERSELQPWETQIRVYGRDGALLEVSPELPQSAPATELGPPPPLPRLERWHFSGSSPQIDPSYDDSAWTEIPAHLLARGEIDIDALGVHHGFIWYRGTFQRPLDRLLLDARHCYSVWINRQLVAVGDQFQNTLGVGPDGARLRRISLDGVEMGDGRNALVILVESLGHNKGFADDAATPRGIVRLDTGSTPIQWRFRGGMLRGERGLTPVVAIEGVERTQSQEVVLPHGWAGDPLGIGLYETTLRLDGIDPKTTSLGLRFDPGRGKANLYLNGYLIGRYWPERGPQQSFMLPWGLLKPDDDNQIAVALWNRSERAALGKIRLEVL
jgi:hypothetical protein